ncbi:unnamed protein product [Brugia pahangi]|uniref:CACTA en-spm transposon protein n=1 Tax=Brugia pahangi TaxID=6280 RepID=A0A0N4TS80_BRUPA|nr:unnamed protein product [Brugia pahangi]
MAIRIPVPVMHMTLTAAIPKIFDPQNCFWNNSGRNRKEDVVIELEGCINIVTLRMTYGICSRQFETLKGWHISRTRKEDGRYSSLDEAAAACPSSPSSSSGKDMGVTEVERRERNRILGSTKKEDGVFFETSGVIDRLSRKDSTIYRGLALDAPKELFENQCDSKLIKASQI